MQAKSELNIVSRPKITPYFYVFRQPLKHSINDDLRRLRIATMFGQKPCPLWKRLALWTYAITTTVRSGRLNT